MRVSEEEKQLPVDSGDSTESYFTGMEEMDTGDIYLSLIKSHRSRLGRKYKQRLRKNSDMVS